MKLANLTGAGEGLREAGVFEDPKMKEQRGVSRRSLLPGSVMAAATAALAGKTAQGQAPAGTFRIEVSGFGHR